MGNLLESIEFKAKIERKEERIKWLEEQLVKARTAHNCWNKSDTTIKCSCPPCSHIND